jgi:pyruvate kinase
MIKILPTIGPASEDTKSILNFSKKTKIFRLNGSHANIEWHTNTISRIRSICPDAFILLDIPGIKPRTLNEGNLKINKGDKISFGLNKSSKNYLKIKLTKPLPRYDKNLKLFSVNDGQFIFDVIESHKQFIVGKSKSTFTLLPNKGINLPNSIYNEKKQLNVYTDFIKKIINLDVNALGLSFVQSNFIVNEVRKIVPDLVLISKLENSEGLRNSVNIINSSDAIMIDRGDLAAEIGLETLYNAVEEISSNTKKNGKPLIMATENLGSMIDRQTPSKSDVMSIVHSISVGADCIMLSEETALAENSQQIMDWLTNFINKLKPIKLHKVITTTQKKFPEIWQLIKETDDIPALLMTKSGYGLFNYISIKPNASVIIITSNKKIIEVSKLFSNDIMIVETIIKDEAPIETIWEVIQKNKISIFKKNEKIIAIYVSKYISGARANSISYFHKKDFI